MNPHELFEKEMHKNIKRMSNNTKLGDLSLEWMNTSASLKYTYHFKWLGRPIIQYPQDIVAMQEIIWAVKPDLIIETGIAHGGSAIFHASMMALLEKCGCIEKGHVVAVDIDIREHNRIEIDKHPLSSYITMIQGSSVDQGIIDTVKDAAKGYKKTLVSLDSNHTKDHVLAELEAYTPLVSVGSYCVVFDTVIEDMPEEAFPDRPWGKGDNPKTAVWEYLRRLKYEGRKAVDGVPLHFEIDKTIENKLLITVAPDGYLKRVAAAKP